MGLFGKLTPDEAGRLDAALFGSLEEMPEGHPAEDDVLGVIDDLRTEQSYMPPDTAGFRLPLDQV